MDRVGATARELMHESVAKLFIGVSMCLNHHL